ncbi:MAG TPA: HAMP domain-containing sensor histidine kinase [Solirubrobacteraceae bacterium]|nr:HAMP domain-containing sensor histidine kinase [Solirubrobacteraceae bacterium]
MSATGWPAKRSVELGWAAFAALNLGLMIAYPSWETIPFHLIWISLTLVYGFRVWRLPQTVTVLAAVAVCTGASILADAFDGIQLWGELFEVPLMSAMFLAMVWHAQRRQAAMVLVQQQAEERRELLERQERFLDDASHELLTPVTIARGHLEVLCRQEGGTRPEVDVALDELHRIDRIVRRLLLLAKAGTPDFVVGERVDVESFVEDVFMRWSEIQPRAWRLGELPSGTVVADPEALRIALDALLENAVKYSEPGAAIELRGCARGESVAIEVADRGIGIAPDATARIFERFARADASRSRDVGGIGLGLAIVDAIAKAHGGRCTVSSSPDGSTFSLVLPRFEAAPDASAPPADLAAASDDSL